MRPRQQMVCLNTESSIEKCIEVAEQTRFSRFPLAAEGDPDRTLGVVHIKDLYTTARQGAKTAADLAKLARKILFVPELAPLEKLLELFLERKLHFAVVVDEYGGTTGMVTLENVLEELVGQIQDEFDQEKPLTVALPNGGWELDGSLPLHELAALVGETVQAEGVSTVSGWVTMMLGGFPREGDKVALALHELRVLEIDGMRVAKLRLYSQTPSK